MCLLLFLFFFLRLSARVWNVRWFQTENFISLHRVTHNNTHAYTFINTRTRVRDAKRKANNGKHWLISISPNDDDDDEKENTVLERYWFGTVITSRGLRILSFYFPCSPSTNRRKKRKPKPPQDIFLSWNWVMQFSSDAIERRTWYIDEIRFKTKMKIESDLWKWKLNGVHIALVKINRCIASACVCGFVKLEIKSFYNVYRWF